MRTIRYIQHLMVVAVLFCTTLFSSCSVHEMPNINPLEPYPFVLHLDYSTELPLYKVVEHIASRAEAADEYDVRYTIEAYASEPFAHFGANELVRRAVFTFDDVNMLNRDIIFELPLGIYDIFVWTDYVKAGTDEHLFYNTDRFRGVVLHGEHTGNTDYRDAFVGSVHSEVTKLTTDIYVSNERPLAKFNLVTIDFEHFIQHLLELKAEQEKAEQEKAEQEKAESEEAEGESGEDIVSSSEFIPTLIFGDQIISAGNPTRVIDLSDYRIVVHYMSNMPNEFHVMRNEPIDAAPIGTVSFESGLTILSDNEAELAFDYVMVSKNQMTVRIAIEVYDERNTKISTSKVFDVPLMRSKLTTIRANFLTTKSSGGLGINPDFEGPDHIHIFD